MHPHRPAGAAMLVIALSHAVTASIALIGLFFVVFPALVAGLVLFAIVESIGERSRRRRPRRPGPRGGDDW